MVKPLELKGKVFGRLKVLRRANPASNNEGCSIWVCMCSCGKLVIVAGKLLMSGNTKSCGCFRREVISKLKLKDLAGKQFGSWKVLKRCTNHLNKRTKWICECDCGAVKSVDASTLIRGISYRCYDCAMLDKASKRKRWKLQKKDNYYEKLSKKREKNP